MTDMIADAIDDIINELTLNIMEQVDRKYHQIIDELCGPCKVKVKLLNDTGTNAQLPNHMSLGASGYDIYASRRTIVAKDVPALIHTGIAIEVPPGWEAQCRPRSGLAKNGLWTLWGTVDSDYRGELMVCAVFLGLPGSTVTEYTICRGDRIAQLVFNRVNRAEFTISDELSITERGTGGYGSTGKL